ncbi:MAG: stage II sporulation protein M [Proteobacteria bacterium]|nr:stage II sporulation protein M [Pseudomonadota bacterium]
MIIDLNNFIKEEQPFWSELEEKLENLDKDAGFSFDLSGVKRFHYLYQRASSDLAKIMNFSAEQDIKVYLESLVARAYSEINESRKNTEKFNFLKWLFKTFPQTFRKQIAAFWISLAIISAGCIFGIAAIAFDTDSKEILMPFSNLMIDPSERVAKEESAKEDRMAGHKSYFSAHLMTNNIRVSIFAMGLGITWGVGTILVLFVNGTMLGAVIADYVLAGKTKFLLGWLLPHGSVEIPAILIAAQAGLVIAGALIGWGKPISLRQRLREISSDIVTLIGGVSVMLIWAGIIEAFLSQYHEPVISYELKIAFGIVELVLLILFLSFSGRQNFKKSTL